MRGATLLQTQRAPPFQQRFKDQRRSAWSGLCRLRTLVVVTPLLLALPLLMLLWQRGLHPSLKLQPVYSVAARPADDNPASAHDADAASYAAHADAVTPRTANADADAEENGCDADFVMHKDTDFKAGDLESVPARIHVDVQACCEICKQREDDGCRGFTLTESGECWLKADVRH